MLKALLVDDENKSRESLKILIEDFCDGVEVVAMASSVDEALEALNTTSPNIVFLDIRMNKETGFDFLNKCSKIDFQVVFTTAYSEYAIDAIKFSALDYLLKPINIEDLKNAIDKAEKKFSNNDLRERVDFLFQNFKVDSSDNFKLVLPTSEGLMFINFKDILYCEASSNYTIFHMRDSKKYVVSKTLKEYEDLLVNYNFFRIHNSFLINLREIVKYVKGDGGYVVLSNDKSLDVSKRKKEFFLTKLSNSKII
ncbi:MAG TPA: LytTR family DNA-binding domain-containing protein [Cytophagaceae bacterium]|jgi:two-component system LytT family response regulator|nr:LytTR family DNA-binding domain-containing protein [Cytophagaceae bacterium]